MIIMLARVYYEQGLTRFISSHLKLVCTMYYYEGQREVGFATRARSFYSLLILLVISYNNSSIAGLAC